MLETVLDPLDLLLTADVVGYTGEPVTDPLAGGHLLPHLVHHTHGIGVYGDYLRPDELAGVDGREELPSQLCTMLLRHPLLVLGGLTIDRGHLRPVALLFGIVLLGVHEGVVAGHVQFYKHSIRPGVLDNE